MKRVLFYALFCACFAQNVVAQELLFSFSPIPSNGALSKRPFSKNELLVVTVTGMAPGERLTLERCGNARCSVGAAVAEWTFDDFARHSPAEVKAEGDRYGFLLFNGNKGVVGTEAILEHGLTTIRFSSGAIVTVELRSSL